VKTRAIITSVDVIYNQTNKVAINEIVICTSSERGINPDFKQEPKLIIDIRYNIMHASTETVKYREIVSTIGYVCLKYKSHILNYVQNYKAINVSTTTHTNGSTRTVSISAVHTV
jgi:hypothetical protein